VFMVTFLAQRSVWVILSCNLVFQDRSLDLKNLMNGKYARFAANLNILFVFLSSYYISVCKYFKP
jgi:hypothetical protein